MGNTDKAARGMSARAGEQHLAHLEHTLRLRYLGLGFIWAWIYGSFETSAVYPERAGSGINADASWIVSAATVTLALFTIGIILGRRPRPAPAWLVPAAAAGGAAGTVLSALFPSSFALGVLASGLLTGIGTATLTVLWGQALTQLGRETAELAIPASSVIMLVGSLVFPYLPPTVGVLAAASLLVASGAALMLTNRDLGQREATPDQPASPDAPTALLAPSTAFGRPPATVVRIAVLLFLAYGILCCAEALQGPDEGAFVAFGIDWPVIIGSCGGIVLMTVFLLFSARPSFDALFRLMVPLVTAGVALVPWADLWAVFAASVCFSIANTMLTIAATLSIVTAAQGRLINPALGIGITQGALQLGVFVGNAAGLGVAGLTGSSPTGLFAVSLGLLAFLSLSWLAYPVNREHRRRLPSRDNAAVGAPAPHLRMAATEISTTTTAGCEPYAVRTAPARSAAPVEIADPSPAAEMASPSAAALDERCRILTEAHGLSTREAEILGYLARGRSQPYIRDELVLSKNTVATHVKHIYQKLNVHSRQELLDLFE